MRRRCLILAAAVAAAAPLPALAAPGYAVCMGLDSAGQGRVVTTAEPYARDSARADADAIAFGRVADAQGKAKGVEPACHWEPTREKAADYLRRFRQGAGKTGAEAVEVAFSPQG